MKNFKNKIFIFVILVVLFMSMALTSCIKKEYKKSPLSNKNSEEYTIKLYEYICSTYQHKIISGQQESTWIENNPNYEMEYIYNATNKYPAIRGLDFMGDDFDGVVERAINWHKEGGIVSICWHCGKNFSGNYENAKCDENKENRVSNWNDLLKDGTEDNKVINENLDKAAKALLKLQDEKVPVLFRPFHEFDGGWFWWSGITPSDEHVTKQSAENFKKLWKYVYNKFTNEYHLNNLIWVLGYSHDGEPSRKNCEYKKDVKLSYWYPGDEYCDIVGADSYEVKENGAEQRLYDPLYKLCGDKKPLIMHECGLIPKIDDLKKVKWGAFMTWHSEWLIDNNSREYLYEIYNSDYVITLDDVNY